MKLENIGESGLIERFAHPLYRKGRVLTPESCTESCVKYRKSSHESDIIKSSPEIRPVYLKKSIPVELTKKALITYCHDF